MDSYSLFADVMTSFRSSPDFVKIIWICAPLLTLWLVLRIFRDIVALFRMPFGKPLLSLDYLELGRIYIYVDHFNRRRLEHIFMPSLTDETANEGESETYKGSSDD